MDEKDWLILKTIYEEKNITKAAEKLFISQPALTYRLNHLEEEVGVKILWRNKKGIKFTSEGEYLVKYADEMLYKLQKTKDHLLNMNENLEGIIRIGVSSNFARYLLPDILKNFLEQYHNVQFSVFTGWSHKILKHLEQDNIHIGIVRGDNPWHHNSILLNTETICVISSKPIDLMQLPSLPRITFNTDPKLQQIIDNWWHQQFSQPPTITMEIDNIETCKKLVAKGLGYAIVPSLGLSTIPDLEKIELNDNKGQLLQRNTWLLYKETEVEFPIVKEFINSLINYSQIHSNK
ncbi:LysR family transcriptional regulator [Halalkalibacter krulwichiae]|uniref:HTH-type transcriptional regulator YofA n=1 Tax=Halalkalibacter krulwichiae TaxID=199441 RepID=A0A1X9MAV5_9BACI|nr:LysR family transcriptional regulator [Halalkalibacter krulwichiae]ARK29764.1 HTH-type transcriptional regulator YofA [Halalkalibacter krulwichiae]